ncbi:hypothetical protein [Frigoriflavimonas asaccharolytica]|uniref:Lipoprotein n=1 Tax=Frigoriflavimonas asaccharolytica TaxID=2735899 RepID=A0A8J8K9Y2_9FLAO|nr:hypothetical protein [Frigoriflavimonas asaccharolytica]NRS94141.1 hypothetical protein [Frigoriflavimonas asaccharolytica]
MQINKYIIICSLLFTISCKTDKNKQNQKISQADTLKVSSQKEKIPELYDIENFTKESIVITCGSGCALSYSPEKISRRGNDLVVDFKVLMYEDEIITDSYNEIYVFSYNNSKKLEKIVKDSESGDFLATQMPNTREAFRSFGENLINSEKVKTSANDFVFESIKLPYHKKIDINEILYNTMATSAIIGLSEFACGEENIRYINLERSKNINLILIPMDCGDSQYRFYLISIANKSVISNLYVEGELFEPESYGSAEKTSFTVDEHSIINVFTENKDFKNNHKVLKKYKITNKGQILEIKY